MKKLMILLAALLLVAACGSVSGPSETSFDVEYVIKTLGGQQDSITIMYNEGSGVFIDTVEVYTSEWTHEFTASPGDTLRVHGSSDSILEVALYINNEHSADANPDYSVGIYYILD